ncbi:MAG TPA: PBP1A family penicillin-binding protein [Anaerolineae bacterium]|nr:PBP1A family penicillin-binding protein [Anaerolineae bacterium]
MRRRLKLLIASLILLSLACAAGVYAWLFVDLPALDALYERAAAPSTKILDRNGRLLYEIIDPHWGKHTPVPLDAIPPYCRQATIATEDANFYTNPGVDFVGIVRAVWINLEGGETLSGGSTITQQLARNLLLSPEERSQRTLTRKLRESILAWRMAGQFGKDDILALYLNEVYYGNLAYGIEAAAQAYFGAPVGQLDLAQCALLAGLPQAPATYDPLANLPAAKERQAVVLDLMVKAGYIEAEQAELARAENLNFAATPFPIEAPHFVAFVTTWLEDRYGLEAIYTQGLIVTTTLDLNWQHAAESIAGRRLQELQDGSALSLPKGSLGKHVNNAALVALDPNTGEIRAMLGSPDYFNAQIDGAVNAVLAHRQPGSSIKPITYAAAFDPAQPDPLTPASMILDVRTSFPTREGDPYAPRNYDLQFHGPVSAREALASSYNIPAVKVLQRVGLDRMIGLARSLGIGTFGDSSRYGLSLTLGGGEVRLIDLVSAYGAFANGGQRVTPAAVRQVTTAAGETLYNVQPQLGEQALDPRVAYLISHILSDNGARASAFGEFSVLRLTRPAAVKTGTTTDWRDNWTVGYTPDVVVGVWVGNADNQPMERVSGVAGAGPIWRDFMEAVLKGKPVNRFERPDGLVDLDVCATSGLLPTPYCPFTQREVFIAGAEPTQPDNLYRSFAIDVATGQLATPDTPRDRVATRVYLVLPAEAQEWARENGIPQLPVAAVNGDPLAVNGDQRLAIRITRPYDGTLYKLTPQTPIESQRIPVQAIAADGVQIQQLTLLVDGQPIGAFDSVPVRAWWQLSPGRHVFTVEAIDRQGNSLVGEPVAVFVTQ